MGIVADTFPVNQFIEFEQMILHVLHNMYIMGYLRKHKGCSD